MAWCAVHRFGDKLLTRPSAVSCFVFRLFLPGFKLIGFLSLRSSRATWTNAWDRSAMRKLEEFGLEFNRITGRKREDRATGGEAGKTKERVLEPGPTHRFSFAGNWFSC